MKAKELWLPLSISVLLFIVIATSEFRLDSIYLFFLGAALNALPVIVGKLIGRSKITETLFIAATYGGGNRGVFLVSFFFPTKLLEFMIIDLGNYISLLLIYPLAFRKKFFEAKRLFLLLLTFIAIISGIYVHINNAPCHGCSEVKSVILYAIMIYTLAQIIQWLRGNWRRIRFDTALAWFLSARVCIVALPLLLYYFITASWEPVLLLFIVLPTSSLLFVFFNRDDHIYDTVVIHSIMSTLVYFFCVLMLFILRNILGLQL